MRAVIQFSSDSGMLNKETVKNILIEDGWNIIDFSNQEFWLNPDNFRLKFRRDKFVNAIQPAEASDLEFFYYIYREAHKNNLEDAHDNNREGIVSRNKQTNYFGIRIFKNRKKILRESCERTVEHLIDKIDSPRHPLKFYIVRIYAQDGEGELVEAGVVHKNKREKIRLANKQKKFEYTGTWTLLVIVTAITIISIILRDDNNTFIKNDFITEFWLIYLERLIPPLVVSGGLMFYQYYSHRLNVLNLASIIEWRDE